MPHRILPAAAAAVLALGLAVPAGAFDLTRAATEAELQAERDTGALFIRVGLRAELMSDQRAPVFPPEPVLEDDIVIGWGPVGGIEPTPFQVLIPAGCFVDRGGFRVEDFVACGVAVSFDGGASGAIGLEIRDFAARIGQRGNGTAVVDMEALVADPRGSLAPDILATLGGEPVGIAVDTDTGVMAATAPVLKTESQSGVEPTPF